MLTVKKKYHPLLLSILGGILFFSHLNSWSPPTIMEARNFISAREMVASNEWLIPTLNEKTRIRKPPLPTWLSAISIKIAGDENDLTALRLPAAIAGIVMLFFLYGLVKDIFDNEDLALYASIILGSFYMIVQESHTGSWDIFCNTFMLGGVWMLYKGFQSERSFKYFVLSGLLLGASFLSKGPVSFYTILLPFVAAYFLSRHKIRSNKTKGLIVCGLITIIMSSAWPLYLYFKIPEVARAIANEESDAWINRHNRPPWFYLHFMLFTGIWALTTLFSFIRYKKVFAAYDLKKAKFVLFWFIITFILLSVVPEKKERYFLPALLPLAVWVGNYVFFVLRSIHGKQLLTVDKTFILVQGIINTLALLSLPILLYKFGSERGDISTTQLTFYSLVLGILLITQIYVLARKKNTLIYPISASIMMVFVLTCWPIIPNIGRKNPNFQDLRGVREIMEIQHLPLYTKAKLSPERMWEIGKHINILSEEEKYPASNAVIISGGPLELYKVKKYTFHYNPGKKEDVLYFYVLN